MAVAQLVRAPVCGTGGCGFNPRQPPLVEAKGNESGATPDALLERFRSVAQLVEHRSPKPAVVGSSPPGPVAGRVCLSGSCRERRSEFSWCFRPVRRSDCQTVRPVFMAVSSRGLGHGPLKAGTRVRIPLPLFRNQGSFVYRLGRHPFTVQRRVRLPYGLCTFSSDSQSVGQPDRTSGRGGAR